MSPRKKPEREADEPMSDFEKLMQRFAKQLSDGAMLRLRQQAQETGTCPVCGPEFERVYANIETELAAQEVIETMIQTDPWVQDALERMEDDAS